MMILILNDWQRQLQSLELIPGIRHHGQPAISTLRRQDHGAINKVIYLEVTVWVQPSRKGKAMEPADVDNGPIALIGWW